MKLKIIGVPMHYGVNTYGLNCGIDELKKHDSSLNSMEMINIIYDSAKDRHEKNLKFINTVNTVCTSLATSVSSAVEDNYIPLIIGGDHSISIGSVSGVAKHKKIGILWLDAHADMNTPSITPTGNIHGMPLSALQGYGDDRLVNCFYKGKKVNEENVVVFGARDLDKQENEFVKELDNTIMWYSDIEKQGIDKSLAKAYDLLMNKTEGIHLSIDIDSIDPKECPGVSVPVKSGFKRKEALYIIEYFLKTKSLVSIDLVEYNPVYDKGDKTLKFALDVINLIKKYYE